jgi:hypothetical protein
MGTSSSAHPPDGDFTESEEDDDDDLELTSVMNVEQQRALRKAARKAAEAEETHDPERPTARPAPAATPAEEITIPKAPPVPTEVAAIDREVAPVAPPQPVAHSPAATARARSIAPLSWLSFLLLAAAIAYVLRP